MKCRICALVFVVLAAASAARAAPILYWFSGRASGTIGSTGFTNKGFRVSVTSEPLAVHLWSAGVYACPAGEPASIQIEGVGTADFLPAAGASVFYNQSGQVVGFWNYGYGDYLDIQTSLGMYDLKSAIGPVAGPNGSWIDSVPTSLGALTMNSTSVAQTAFQASIIPEPAFLTGMAVGMAARYRRRR